MKSTIFLVYLSREIWYLVKTLFLFAHIILDIVLKAFSK